MGKCIHCGKETAGLICDNDNCKQKGKMIVSPFMLTDNEIARMISLCSNYDENGESETVPMSYRRFFELQLNNAINSADDMAVMKRKGIREQAENGDWEAQSALGISLLREKKPEAYIWLKRAGLRGNIIALIGMARCYMSGFGVTEDGDSINPSESLGNLIEELIFCYLYGKIDYEKMIEILKCCLSCQDNFEQLKALTPLTDESVKRLSEIRNHISSD